MRPGHTMQSIRYGTTTAHHDPTRHLDGVTLGRVVGALAFVPAFLALLAVPTFVLGAALGVVAVELVERLLDRRPPPQRVDSSLPSPPADAESA